MEINNILNDFKNFGYSYIELPNNIFLSLIELPKLFYNLPIEKRYRSIASIKDGILGYTPSESELTITPIKDFKGNKKRGYSSFDFLPNNSTILGANRLFRSNKWASNEISEIANNSYNSIKNISSNLAENILLELGIIENDIFNNDNTLSLMRLLLYKSRTADYTSKAHTDYEFISFIISETDGLEIKNKNKEWVKVPTKQNCATLLAGDMLEAISNGNYKSTMHRVTNSSIDRTSTIFFQGLPLDYRVKYKTENIDLNNTFGGHILPLLLSGAVHLQDNKQEIAEELNIEMSYSNPFKTDK